MIALILALSLAQSEPAAEAAPRVAKVAADNPITCKWVTNSGGFALEVCRTKHDWRLDQIERQRRVDDFQRRALHTQPR